MAPITSKAVISPAITTYAPSNIQGHIKMEVTNQTMKNTIILSRYSTI